MITQAQLAVSTDVRQRALLTCQPVKQLVPESNQVVVDRVAFVGAAAVVAHGKKNTELFTVWDFHFIFMPIHYQDSSIVNMGVNRTH